MDYNGLKYLYNCTNINLGYTYITDNDLSHLSNCKIISLVKCKKITDNGLSYLSNCTTIDLSRCNITDKCLKYLSNCKIIYLSECKNITDKGLSYLNNCKEIDISGCKYITDKSLKYLIKCDIIYYWGSACFSDMNITKEGIKYLKRNNINIIRSKRKEISAWDCKF